MAYAKKWIIYTLVSIFVTLCFFATINFAMDPLWTFEHSHKYNQHQRARKERQQKSNVLYFRTPKYDTLLFGSSRITYMNQHKWDRKTFNYAVSDMQPNEYNHYLNFAINEAKQPIKRVIIGLDFFGALTYSPLISKDPQAIISPITKPLYRYKLLLSLDSLDYSFKNIKYYFQKKPSQYSFDNVKSSPPKKTLHKYEKKVKKDITVYLKNRYSKLYDEKYLSYIKKLKESHPYIEFIVFTTPVTVEHFKALISQNLYSDYERWIQESVSVFGELKHFMYLNDLTNNYYEYFQDSNHAYDTTYECISNEIMNKDTNCPKTKMIINTSNVFEKLQELKEFNLK